jgi:hypothetical protein
MSTVAHLPVCPPVEPNEKCDAECPALALVAILYPKRDGSGYWRLVFCAHHFADLEPAVKELIIAKHEMKIQS